MEGPGDRQILEALRARTEALVEGMGRPRHLFPLDPEACALVVIDVQDVTCHTPEGRPLEGLVRLVDRVNRLARRCRQKGIPVIWIRQGFQRSDGGDDAGLYPLFHGEGSVEKFWRTSAGTELHGALEVAAADPVLVKNRYSCFSPGACDLPGLLQELQRRHLLVAGVATNVCVESTIRDAMQIGYEVTLVSDATESFDEVFKEFTLANVRLFFGDVKTTEEVLGELGSPSVP